ncbi:MAG TPA: TonB-dependent receptor [Longimicrobiaceae bacterium]|nr:TonB-dependent receptor [Longimicrobiaceae bacterium]
MKSTHVLFTCVCAALLAPPLAHAQDAGEISLESLLNQEVSSASKFAQRIADAPSAVTVVTAEDIRRMGAVDLPDALRMVPGLSMRAKTRGTYTASARNAYDPASPRMLVLVDGRPTALEIHSTTLWEAVEVALEQVERIEVVRGPGSALYGGNAYDGVISITTRRPAGGTDVVSSVAAGEHRERQATVTVRHTAAAVRIDGFAQTAASGLGAAFVTADGTRLERSTEMNKGSLRLGWSNARGVDVELAGGMSDGKSIQFWTLGEPFAYKPFETRYAQLGFTLPALVGGAELRSRVNFIARTLGDPALDGTESTRTEGEVTLSRALGAHRGILGATANHLHVEENYYMPEHADQNIFGVYVQDIWSISRVLEVTAGARYDRHPLAGGKVSPRATLLVRPSPLHTVRTSAGRAFRYPTVLENHMRLPLRLGGGLVIEAAGSEKLRPEGITSYEMGYIGSPHPALTLTADLFVNRYDNAVRFQMTDFIHLPNGTPIPVRGEFTSVAGGNARGGELGAVVLPAEWLRFQANYAYLDLENAKGMRVLTAPEHKVNAEVGVRPLRPVWVNLTYHHLSEADYTGLVSTASPYGHPTVLPAGGIFHLNAAADLWRGLSGSVLVQNLGDRRYQDIYGGESFGRRVVAKLSMKL